MTRSKIDDTVLDAVSPQNGGDSMTERIIYPRREAAFQLGMSVRTLDEYAKVGEIHPRFIVSSLPVHGVSVLDVGDALDSVSVP